MKNILTGIDLTVLDYKGIVFNDVWRSECHHNILRIANNRTNQVANIDWYRGLGHKPDGEIKKIEVLHCLMLDYLQWQEGTLEKEFNEEVEKTNEILNDLGINENNLYLMLDYIEGDLGLR
jgi:hypothetical protein